MKNNHKIIEQHKSFFSDKQNIYASILGITFFFFSLIINHLACTFAFNHASSSVTDLLLDNLPLINVDDVFIEGAIIFAIFVTLILLKEPKKIPFVTKSMGLFILIRAFFVILTHIGPFPVRAPIDWTTSLNLFTSGSDLFFSGHTGLPFLLSLIFWENYYLRIIFLLSSIVAGVSVLLGHLHYSIDVFAAYFITYSIYHLCLKFFK